MISKICYFYIFIAGTTGMILGPRIPMPAKVFDGEKM